MNTISNLVRGYNGKKLKINFRFSRFKLIWNLEHLALSLILLLSTYLGFWNLSINGFSNQYYAAAVRSMAQSWHNFFYVSFDPGGFVTVDKPPVALWIQTAFVKVFGYSGVTLLLPEALAGVGGVFLLYLMVKRSFGSLAGLLSALFLTVTPIWVVMNRHNNPESILVFTLILAAWAMLRAAEKGQLRWLLLGAILVGLAFNVKMLEAYVVLPAFFLMYFLTARVGWKKRLLHLTLAGLVILTVSFSWALAVDLTPAAQRPYVDNSTTNSELDLILNYNGLGRVDGNMPHNPGGGTAGPGGTGGGAPSGFVGQYGVARMLTPELAGEYNWFFPLALPGLLLVAPYILFTMSKGEARSRRLQSILLWGGWWLIYGLVFSFSKGINHSYYLNIMAPAQAALAGIALVILWQGYRLGGWRAWFLPEGLFATAVYQTYILAGYPGWNKWVSPVLLVAGICTLIAFGVGRFNKTDRFGGYLSRGVIGVMVAILLATPLSWSFQTVFSALSGSLVSAIPEGAGSGSSNNGGISQAWLEFIGANIGGQLYLLLALGVVFMIIFGLSGLFSRRSISRLLNPAVMTGLLLAVFLLVSAGWWIYSAQAQTTTAINRPVNNPGGDPQGGSGQNDQRLLQYLVNNRDGYYYLVAFDNSNQAAPFITQTGLPVMSLGGFLGNDRIVTTPEQVAQLVASHKVRFFQSDGGQDNVVNQYLQQHCQVVSRDAYMGSSSSTANQPGNSSANKNNQNGLRPGGDTELYQCGEYH